MVEDTDRRLESGLKLSPRQERLAKWGAVLVLLGAGIGGKLGYDYSQRQHRSVEGSIAWTSLGVVLGGLTAASQGAVLMELDGRRQADQETRSPSGSSNNGDLRINS